MSSPSLHRFLLLPFVLACLLSGHCSAALLPTEDPPAQRAALPWAAGSQTAEEGMAAVFIRLTGTPAAVVYGESLSSGGSGVLAQRSAGWQAQAQVAALDAQHATFAAALARSGIAAQELYRVTRVLNGFALRMRPADMAAARQLPGVAAVDHLPLHRLSHASSVPFIGAPRLWEGTPLNIPGVRGEGMRIGIIDSGIDYQHPGFGGSGALAGYQANDRTRIDDSVDGALLFPTAKVVGGWDFAGDGYRGGSDIPVPDADPTDCQGHGSHVAGSAAGLGVRSDGQPFAGPWNSVFPYSTLRIAPGVAPAASLYALRAFGCANSNSALVVQAMEWALDPDGDGDLGDRLDVINLSLGDSFGQDEAMIAAAEHAARTGMIVVAAAGNSDDVFFIASAPASAPSAISVAAVFDTGSLGPLQVNAPAPIAGYKNAGFGRFAPFPPRGLRAALVAVDDGVAAAANGTRGDACETPFTNAAAVAGKIAFVDSENCSYQRKAYNAQLSGAVGVVIGNVAGSAAPEVAPFMSGDAAVPAVTIPTLSLALADADALRAALPGGDVVVTLRNAEDNLAGFSSRGPAGGPGAHYIKPDIAAPGVGITSVQTGVTCADESQGCSRPDADGYIPDGAAAPDVGTSMATPHVAGYAALVRQMNPSASVAEIKALVLNAAAHDPYFNAGTSLPAHGAARSGAGRVDAGRPLSPVVAFNEAEPEKVGVTFNAFVTGATTQTASIRLLNRTALAQRVELSLASLTDAPGVAFTLPAAAVTVPARAAVSVRVRMNATAKAMKRFRDPTLLATQATFFSPATGDLGALPRHWLAEESALLKISLQGEEIARVPVYMAHRPYSDLVAYLRYAAAATTPGGNAELRLGGTGLCTGQVSGARCTGSFDSTDHTALVSGFELQYRGARDEAVPGHADLRFAGISHDAATNTFLFGIATHEPWNSPSLVSFNICVDGDEDGRYDKVLSNTNFASIDGALAEFPWGDNDVFMKTVFDPVSNDLAFGGAASYVNIASAAQMDTALLDNNVLVMGATAAQLGLADGDGSLRYAIAVCPHSDPRCVRLQPREQCSGNTAIATIPGTFRYDAARKGVRLVAGTDEPTLLAPLQSGAKLRLSYDSENLQANGSSGLLLLHHRNPPSRSAQTVELDGLFSDSLEL